LSFDLEADAVTGNFFQVLGVSTAAGRLLEPRDDLPGSAPVAVVSWGYWKTHYGLDPKILGTTIRLDSVQARIAGATAPLDHLQATVVGVVDPRFSGVILGRKPDVWIPTALVPGKLGLSLMARLKGGVSIRQAEDQMRGLDRDRLEGFAARDPQWRRVRLAVTPAATGLSTPLHEQFGGPVRMLMLLLGVMLLLACANLGSLLLARAAAREREMAVRVSLGAGRLRLVRQMLTESLLLAIVGGLAGLMAARVAGGPLVRLMSAGARSLGTRPPPEVPLDISVLGFTTAITIVAAIGFGLAPAIIAFVAAPAASLRGSGATTTSRTQRLAGRALVVTQVALSLVLLTVSWLYAAHLAGLRDRSLGFDRNSVLLLSIDTSHVGLSREQGRGAVKALLARFETLPGVRAATVSGMTPMSGAGGSRFLTVPGFTERLSARHRVSLNSIAPKYFNTYRTPMVAGRDFEPADESGRRVVIVNEALARHYFPSVDPLDRQIFLEGDPQPFDIIGVAADAKYQDVRVPAPETVYFDCFRQGTMPSEFTLRTSVPPESLADDARRLVELAMNGARVRGTRTLAEQIDAAIGPERLIATLSGFFGGVGALLAAIGLYGLIAYTVARRTREIGLRMALGATRGTVMRAVLVDALRLVAIGVAVGAPLALWGKRVAAAMLENLPAGGFQPILIAAAGLVAVALVAAGIPARRATRVEPVIALRSE
jgi:predicted permease